MSGVLAIWHDIVAEHEAEVLCWYNKQHHAERVGTAGFRRSRRYVAIQGEPRFFIFYETDSTETLISRAYLERANNPTDWSRQAMRHFRNNFRTVCSITLRTDGADGGYVATFRIVPESGREDELRTALSDQLFPAILKHGAILKAQLWEADDRGALVTTGDQAVRVEADQHIKWAVVVSASELNALDSLVTKELAPAAFVKLGASSKVDIGIYALQSALEADYITGSGREDMP